MSTLTLEQFLEENRDKSWHELASLVNDTYGADYNGESLRSFWRRKMGKTPKQGVERDIELHGLKSKKALTEKKYKALLDKIEGLEATIQSFEAVKPTSTFTISPQRGKGTGEATAIVLASDWHIEETVDSDLVSGKNVYNLSIAEKRAIEFFRGTQRLVEITGRDVEIKTLVLALLGDFVTGDIHIENLETCSLTPVEAIIRVKTWIASGIEYLLANTELDLVIPCHSGNHARTTQDRRNATEAGHSLEYIMYHYLADHFRDNKRVKFIIPRGYHSFVDVYGMTLRFHHGHNIRYAGGVGGPTIAVNKAIAQWNKTRWADIDCFGHLHTRFDGGNFLMNGSNIGFNAYAVSIKASFERPSQTFFLIDKKRGKTCVWPIVYSV